MEPPLETNPGATRHSAFYVLVPNLPSFFAGRGA
jgi:hypothetical protein